MDLTVVILTWNSSAYLAECLRSIRMLARSFQPEIVVIDNGSRETASVRDICKAWSVERVMENGSNLGVAAARNQGILAAASEYVCTLDVDTAVTPGALGTMLGLLQADPSIGICAPRLESFDKVLQYSCRRFPTLQSTLCRLAPSMDRWHVLEDFEMRAVDHSITQDVDVVIGACQMFRRRVAMEIGLFSTFSRFGWEDFDFCVRMWQAGLRVVYCPDAVIQHREQRAARGKMKRLTAEHISAIVRYFAKHRYLLSRRSVYSRMPGRHSWEDGVPCPKRMLTEAGPNGGGES